MTQIPLNGSTDVGDNTGLEDVIEGTLFKEGVLEAFMVISTSEFLDRSWIVSVVCIVHYGVHETFVGAMLAFTSHVAISACVGVLARDALTYAFLHLACAVILTVLGLKTAWECYHSDPDKLAMTARKRAETSVEDLDEAMSPHAGRGVLTPGQRQRWWARYAGDVSAVFTLIFRAEWGDQTQLTLVSLQTTESQPAVCVGATLAFIFMLLAATAVGSALHAEQFRERPLLLLNTGTFFAFAVVSGWQAFQTHPWAKGSLAIFRHPSSFSGAWQAFSRGIEGK